MKNCYTLAFLLLESKQIYLHIAYTTFAVQRDVITFSQTQEKKIDFQVMKLIISVWSGSGNC